MSNQYETNVESLDDRTLLAGGLWSTLSSLQSFFSQHGRAVQRGATEVADSSTVEGPNRGSSAGGVWSILDRFLSGGDANAFYTQQASGGWNGTPGPSQSASGEMPSDLFQTFQGIMGEIAGFLQDLQNSFEQDNTPSGQSSSPSNPGMPGSGATGSGSSVQWPFGSNGWPEWLPSFIQQNLQATNSESPPVGSSGGGTSSPSNSSASPGHSPGSSSTGNNSHGGTSGSVNLGGATEQPVSDPTGESTSEEGSSIVSNGSGRDADSQKIPIPPQGKPSADTGTPASSADETESAAVAAAATPEIIATPHGEKERIGFEEQSEEGEDLRALIRRSEGSAVLIAETPQAAEEADKTDNAIIAKSTMWLADLASAFTTTDGWEFETEDLFELLPSSPELEASNEGLGVSPLTLFGTASFAGGALYWQRFGRRKSALAGTHAVDEFFMNLTTDL